MHPGNMGAAIAASLKPEVLWASQHRSTETVERAEAVGLNDAGTVASVVEQVDLILCICPPSVAIEIGSLVGELGFDGIYVDANAVSPNTTRRIAGLFKRFVDGAIIGSPPDPARGKEGLAARGQRQRTRLYVSGEEADAVAPLFDLSNIEIRTVGREPGRASAVKMAHTAWTKGTPALLLSIAALAESEDISETLLQEWEISIPGLQTQLERTIGGVGRKAGRFVGEMEEVAETFAANGLPDGFHDAASQIYERISRLRHEPLGGEGDEILKLLLSPSHH